MLAECSAHIPTKHCALQQCNVSHIQQQISFFFTSTHPAEDISGFEHIQMIVDEVRETADCSFSQSISVSSMISPLEPQMTFPN